MSRLRLVASGKTDGVKLPSALTVFTLLVYAAAMTAYIYGYEHRPDADYAWEVSADDVFILAAAGLIHVALGFVFGTWWALAAVLLPVALAMPAGDYPGGWPDTPVAATMLFQELAFGLPLVAGGVVSRRLLARRRGVNA